jgi:hypothetical protein
MHFVNLIDCQLLWIGIITNSADRCSTMKERFHRPGSKGTPADSEEFNSTIHTDKLFTAINNLNDFILTWFNDFDEFFPLTDNVFKSFVNAIERPKWIFRAN